MSSKETTIAGVIGAIVATLIPIQMMLDGNPDTIPNWESVIPLWIVAFGLIRARDNNKSSEKVGAK